VTETDSDLNSVLIVDDDPILRAIVEVFFQKRGVQHLHIADDGNSALEIVDEQDNKIDFILCDLNMPEMDGIQFLRHLKDRNFLGRIAILSGAHASVVKSAGNLAEAHKLNIVGTLAKPLNIRNLEELVGQLETPSEQANPVAPVLATVHDLKTALMNGDVVPYFQPKVDVATRRVNGAEALARWLHPQLGIIGPNFFIPMAQQNALMGLLTECMITRTIDLMAEWRQQNFTPKVSVNLSAETLNLIDFPDEMAARMAAAQLECASMVFEMTESQLLVRSSMSSEILARLRIMGFGVSIDDFGTGYSNIEQLREFPFSELKIDQSFIREASHDKFARASVEASTKLGKHLDLNLVAEGVETEEEWDFVAKSGIDQVQGYYIAKPMPASEFPGWVQEYEGRVRRQVRQSG